MSRDSEPYVTNTLQWIQTFIIPLNICPFAKREIDKGTVRLEVSPAENSNSAQKELIKEYQLLDDNPFIPTTLVIYCGLFTDFYDYLDFLDLANTNLIAQGYEGIYQLASFHPQYCFANTDYDDVTNYTNRSPYPMIHILREAQLDEAIQWYGDTQQIPLNNMNKLRELGLNALKKLVFTR